MGLRISNLLFFILFCTCAGIHDKLCLPKLSNLSPLEYAIMYEPVSRVQKLLRAGEPLTVQACEYAGARTPVVRLLYEYFRQAVDCYRAGVALSIDTQINLSREQVYACLNALLLHVNDVHDVRALLLLGAHADYVDAAGNNALFYARERGHEDTARILAHEDEKIYEQLLVRVQEKKLTKDFLETYFSGLNRLAINRAYAQLNWHTVLYVAIQENYYDGVKLLLDYDAMGIQEILPMALRHASKNILQLLISRGARLYRVPDFLSVIIRENPEAYEIVKWLAPLTSYEQRNCALITACLQAHESLVMLLLNIGASARYEDNNGVTPLWAAVVGHDLLVVQRICARSHFVLTPDQLKITQTLFPASLDTILLGSKITRDERNGTAG